jgi:electron transfer flavoprotein beta subunit
VRGDTESRKEFRLFREPKPLRDPDSREVLGYEAQYVGAGDLTREGVEGTGADGNPLIVPGTVQVTREVDAGLEILDIDLPAVVTVDLRLNEPRFIKLPDIMKAKSKPLETIAFSDLGVESADFLKTSLFAPPAKRSKGVMVKDVAELVAALKNKGLV